MLLDKSGSMKATDLKKLSSELVKSSKVGVVIPASIERGVYECSVYPARMKMKLPLQTTNEMVAKLAVAGNKHLYRMIPLAICDSLGSVVQSVTELCIVDSSDKKPVAESWAKSVKELGEKIIEVSNANAKSCGVRADNNVATKVVAINEDRHNMDRIKDCLDRYKAVAAVQKALESEIIDAFEDDEVYNKIGADGKLKTL